VQDYLTKFIEYAKNSPDKEVCGIVSNSTFIPITNISIDPNSFIFNTDEYLKVLEDHQIDYIIHSHTTYSSKPSAADIYSCNNGVVPWIIYSVSEDTHTIIQPDTSELLPYIGRSYHFGIIDCWSLVSDVLYRECGIKTNRIVLSDPKWYLQNRDIFTEGAVNNNFIKVNDLKEYDVLLFKIGSYSIPTHSGIKYGDNTFLHHLQDRASSLDVYGPYWNRYTHSIYRHKELI
jgi:proteasome lid subunit RPN8/RPN11